MKFRPTKRALLIQPAKTPALTSGGLFIPESLQRQPNYGIVLKAGKNCKCKPGDRVHFLLGALEMNSDGTAFLVERFCFLMFRGKELKMKNMMVHDGWVVVRVPYIMRQGQKGEISSSAPVSDDAKNMSTCRYGEIICAPAKATNEFEPVAASYVDKDPKVEVKKGDLVFISPYIINSLRDNVYMYQTYTTIKVGEQYQEFFVIPYRELVCKYRGETFISLNKNGIVSKVPEPESTLILPEKKVKRNEQLDNFIMECDTHPHKKGDQIVFPLFTSIEELESEFDIRLSKRYYFFHEDRPLMSRDEEEVTYILKMKR